MPHIDLLNSQMQVNGTQAIFVQGYKPNHTLKILKPSFDLQTTNQLLSNKGAQKVVEWSANTFGDGLVMSKLWYPSGSYAPFSNSSCP